jgi:hypothetical protein
LGESSFKAYGGTWLSNPSKTSEPFDARMGSKDTAFRKKIMDYGEYGLYEDREFEFNESPLYEFAVRFLAASLLSFDLRGKDSEKIKDFIKKVQPTFTNELYSQVVSTIRDGTGFLWKYKNRSDEVRQFKWQSTYNYKLDWIHRKPREKETEEDKLKDRNAIVGQRRIVQISAGYDDDGVDNPDMKGSTIKFNPVDYIREEPCLVPEDYRGENIAMLRLLVDDNFPYGRSIGRSSYAHFKSLNQALKDDMAVIKKLLGTPFGVGLDLSDVDDEINPDTNKKRRQEAMEEMNASIAGIDWERSDAFIFDKKHEVGYIGLMSNSSPTGDGKIIDIMKHIEPVLSACLLNFFIPLGLIEQTGANKSIISQQVLQARKDMIPIKEAFATYLKTQVYPEILKKDFDEFDLEIAYPPNGVAYEIWTTFFSSGLISREYATEALGIVDDGKTFIPIEKPMSPSSGKGDSNDDNPSKKREEQQRSNSGETGV